MKKIEIIPYIFTDLFAKIWPRYDVCLLSAFLKDADCLGPIFCPLGVLFKKRKEMHSLPITRHVSWAYTLSNFFFCFWVFPDFIHS